VRSGNQEERVKSPGNSLPFEKGRFNLIGQDSVLMLLDELPFGEKIPGALDSLFAALVDFFRVGIGGWHTFPRSVVRSLAEGQCYAKISIVLQITSSGYHPSARDIMAMLEAALQEIP
jgi:hypothetical protein